MTIISDLMILTLNSNIFISKAKFDGEIANGFYLFIITYKKIKANIIEFVENSYFSLQNILIKNKIEMKYGIRFFIKFDLIILGIMAICSNENGNLKDIQINYENTKCSIFFFNFTLIFIR